MQKQNLKQKVIIKNDEQILVVKRDYLFPEGAWQGLEKPQLQKPRLAKPQLAKPRLETPQKNTTSTCGHGFVQTIMAHKEFKPRSLMENDFAYKQIIPYLVFKHQDRYFLMQRKAKASETRLKSKYSFGIGGHIRQEDIKDANIASWATREFHEEVDYSGNVDIKFLGVLNDDSNDVGKVHVGFVYLLEGDCDQIQVKEELQSGFLLTLDECAKFYNQMEQWSKIVFDFLK
ncbi:hypothetical protein ACFLYU_01610 [Candidatus Dependentiae bacterium]